MRIEVTGDDLREGKANNCHLCPVARAICRVIGIEHGRTGAISVRESAILVVTSLSERKTLAFDTPQEVNVFIRAYDRGGHFEPFGFDLPDTPEGEAT